MQGIDRVLPGPAGATHCPYQTVPGLGEIGGVLTWRTGVGERTRLTCIRGHEATTASIVEFVWIPSLNVKSVCSTMTDKVHPLHALIHALANGITKIRSRRIRTERYGIDAERLIMKVVPGTEGVTKH